MNPETPANGDREVGKIAYVWTGAINVGSRI